MTPIETSAAHDHPPPRSAELCRSLQQLRWLRLSLVHDVSSTLLLPDFPGNLWHGMLGKTLHDLDLAAYETLYGGTDDSIRGWALVPPAPGDEPLRPGTRLHSQIVLTGPCMALVGLCVEAMQRFGQLGLGPARAKAPLVDAWLEGPQGRCALGDPAAIWSALQVWDEAAAAQWPQAAVQLSCLTPLRIKEAGQVSRSAPPLDALLRRTLARVGRLLAVEPVAPERFMAEGEKAAWLDWAATVPLLHASTRTVGLDRYSGRQRREMVFDGLAGHWCYAAPASQAWPWLRLAECLQIGSKSTFGFGLLRCAQLPAGSAAPR